MVLARHQKTSRQPRNLLEHLRGDGTGRLFDFTSRERDQLARELLGTDSGDLLGGYLLSRADELKTEQPATAALLYALEHDHLLQSNPPGAHSTGSARAGLRFHLAGALIEEGSKPCLQLAVEVLHSTLEGCAVHSTNLLRFHCWETLGYALSHLGEAREAASAFQTARSFSPCAETAAAVRVLAAEALDHGGDLAAAQDLLRSSWRDLHGLGRSANGQEILERWRPFLMVD